MTKIRSWMFVAALVLGGTSTAFAQSTCPTNIPANNLAISGVSATDGASYEIYIGNRTGGGNVGAVVKRNGVCLAGIRNVTKNGAAFSQVPTGINNLCFGTGVEVVTLMSSSLTFSTCSGQVLNALDHGGNTLTLYGSSGADRFFGGPGTEIFWGGPGNDSLVGTSGFADQLFGENDADQISDNTGSFTWIEGGSGADTIVNQYGFFDTIIGGSGNDLIDSSCNPAVIDCGSNTDSLWHPAHGGGEPAGCEPANITHPTWC